MDRVEEYVEANPDFTTGKPVVITAGRPTPGNPSPGTNEIKIYYK
jgi:pyruvate kinase